MNFDINLTNVCWRQLIIIMIEQFSEAVGEDKKQSHVEQGNTNRRIKQLPFNKCSTISFLKVGACHMCKLKGRLVYQCHRNYQATSCQKKFCFDCLTLIYKDNIIDTLQTSDTWRCPYIKKICRCKNCCITRKQPYSVLQLDPANSVYTNLRLRSKAGEQQGEQGEQESMRCLLKEKFKKLIDFNGQLINKVNTNYHKLTEDQIKFYNKLIHQNLSVLNNTGRNMILHQTLIDEG